jgi:hypothetical protein
MVDAALKHENEKRTDKEIDPTLRLLLSDMLAMSGNQHYMEHFNLTKAILEDAYQHAPSPLTGGPGCSKCNKPMLLTDIHLHHSGKCYENLYGSSCNKPNCSGMMSLFSAGRQYQGKKCDTCSHSMICPNPSCVQDRFFVFGASSMECRHCGWSFEILKPDCSQRGGFVLKDGQWMAALNSSDRVVELSTFDRGPSDPTHYGHPFWLFCQWMEVLQSASLEEQSADDE